MTRPPAQKGFTIFFAMLIAALSLAVGMSIYDLAIRELDLSQTATESQFAIYAADTGVECALYWDFRHTDEDNSAFGTSSASGWPGAGSGLSCAGQDITAAWNHSNPTPTPNAATTSFTVSITAAGSRQYCARVEVGKVTVGGILFTTITSRGYNTCDEGSPLRIERALQISY